ncbi:hypothetical protein H2198_002340 [Neophaeococcomyces mojaviensis]|uniref:Uncharacterized protein n=1 Tax=Neophaeococcomyces mojaviensis TaxID=3383035 RepID=A0ACC3AEJ5_9EURO|nr:hypothetical protein H2198_002340 [Knufia sp. JES_112]
MSGYRTSAAPPPNSNLYCTECDSQIGIFENEWTHLTSSYARSQEKGTHFGTEIGVRTQVVPAGSAQKGAEGCEMSEVFCTKCSTVVAQYCRNAPDSSKQHLVGQHFYKISRVYLKDSQTSARVDLIFADGDTASSLNLSGSVRTSAVPRQRLPSITATSNTPFRQSFPPSATHASNHSPYQNFHSQMSPPDHPRPASTLGVSALHHDQNQSAQLAECSSRIVATEVRVASQELRINTNQERLQNIDTSISNCTSRLGMLEANHTALSARVGGHATIIEQQQKKIDEQGRHLSLVTAKLEELQGTIGDLRAIIKEHKTPSQPLLHSSPRPDSLDFLENLEVMVKAMRSARTNDDEIQALRNENKAMKVRLRTIATAMGATSERDLSLLSDEPEAEEMEDSSILGKRKRATNHIDDQARKASRLSGSKLEKLKDSVPPLLTPGSSHYDAQSILDPRERENQVDDYDDEVTDDPNNARGTELPNRTEDDVEALADDDVVEEAEHRPELLNDTKEGTNESTTNNDKSVQWQNLSAGSNTQPSLTSLEACRTDTVSTPAQRPVSGQEFHTGGNATSDLSRSTDPVAESMGMQQSTSTTKGPAYVPQNRSISMHSRTTSPAPALASSLGSLRLPSSQVNNISHANASCLQETATTASANSDETFSGALSRGERLDTFIQRTQSPVSMNLNNIRQQNVTPTQGNGPNTPYEHINVLQPRQGSASKSDNIPGPSIATASEARPKTSVRPPNPAVNAESIDFSDEENSAPAMPPIQNASQTPQPASTTPSGEPIRRATLISRTVRGFTLEPLERPVIQDNHVEVLPQSRKTNGNREGTLNKELKDLGLSHWIGKDKSNEKYREEVRRARAERRKHVVTELQNCNVRAPSIMPEFMAAINNLNESAARQATPALLTAPSKLAETSKRSRRSEPVSRISAAALSSDSKLSGSTITPRAPEVNVSEASKPTLGNPLPRSTSSRSRNQPNGLAAQLTAKAITQRAESRDNDDECSVCKKAGMLIMCNGCPKSYHRRCLTSPPKKDEPEDVLWFCPGCLERQKMQQEEQQKEDKTKKGLLREQVLIERNRLAMEAMEREEAADRQQR